MGRAPQCARTAPKEAVLWSGTWNASEGLFLEYAAHGGFNNQRRGLLNGLLVAYALNRTLLAPPPLSHRLSPHFGACPASVPTGDKVRRSHDAASRAAEVFGGKRVGCSLKHVLALDTVADLVPTVESGRWHDAHASVSVAASNYDCSNTVWTFDSLRAGKVAKKCSAPTWGVKGGCACRDVGGTFGVETRVGKEANLLSWGSTFKGFDAASLERSVPAAVRERLLRATLAYSVPFEVVALRGAMAISGGGGLPTFDYLSVHIRGGDGSFANHLKQTIGRALNAARAQLADSKRPSGPVTLYVATDVNPARLRNHRDFKDAVARLGAQAVGANATAAQQKGAVRLAFLRDAVRDPAGALHAAAAGAKFPMKYPMKCVPDLEMHLDLLLCANAQLGFGGSQGSSMSSSIRTLRKFVLAERSVLPPRRDAEPAPRRNFETVPWRNATQDHHRSREPPARLPGAAQRPPRQRAPQGAALGRAGGRRRH